MSEPALERLRQGPVLCDGAMGTMLYAHASAHLMHGRCFDELTLSAPDLVQQIHQRYILAGAEIVETNTFGANAAKLGAYGLADQTRTLFIGDPIFCLWLSSYVYGCCLVFVACSIMGACTIPAVHVALFFIGLPRERRQKGWPNFQRHYAARSNL